MKSLVTLLALAAVAALPAPAEAQGPGGSPPPAHLLARGKGSIHFQGTGHFGFRLHEKGTLVIEDAANQTIHLLGQGTVVLTPMGEMVVSNFTGEVDVLGPSVKGRFGQGPVAMRADGHGLAVFEGKGWIGVNGTPVGPWTPLGTPVQW